MARLARDVIWIPDVDEEIAPFLTVLPLKLLAYEIADLKETTWTSRNLARR